MSAHDGKPLVVVYHAECIDGAACAWAVAKALGVEKAPNPNVTYIPYAHHDVATAEKKIRAALKGDAEVYFVDVAPTTAFLDEIMTPEAGKPKAQAIHIMDHHNSAVDQLQNYAPPESGPHPKLEMTIDKTRSSAARMVWEKLLPNEAVPPVLDVINMMDGDAKGLTSPHDFAAAAIVDTRDISTPERSFETLRGLATLSFNEMAKAGQNILTDQTVKIDKMMDNARFVSLQIAPDQPPVPVAVVNADVKQFGREISARLVALGKKASSGVALAWYMQKNGVVTMSIRTDGDPDSSKVAAHFRTTMGVTGGGHAGAGAVHFKSLFEFSRHMPLNPVTPDEPKNQDAARPQVRKCEPPSCPH